MHRRLNTVKHKYVNLKAVLRVMREYDLLSQVRRRRPYMHYRRAPHKYPNLLNRQFDQLKPNRFWVADINYIPTAHGMVYMCAEVEQAVAEYVQLYNFERINLKDGLTPHEIRSKAA